jgi:formamidopyrimidine-DNA glycosylase
MPELPEVEVTRLSFANAISEANILSVRTGKPLRWPLGVETSVIAGQKVLAVRRRGKYLLLDLSHGLLLLHLGMSGHIVFSAVAKAPNKHDHFDLNTDKGVLRLTDPRRFGAVVYARDEQDPIAQKLLGKLGVEPLEDSFNLKDFKAALAQRKAPIKQVLLSGNVVVGVGNIYASEALFMAGIRPTTSAMRIGPVRAQRLLNAIRQVLTSAIEKGGSTLRDFSNAHGEAGYFQLVAMVYGREGEMCRQCNTAIQAIRQGQRSTYFCPQCQKH